MSTRTFYFLKDSVSGKFYTGHNNWLAEFNEAAVYHQNANVKVGLKRVISGWEHQAEYADYWIEESKKKNSSTDKKWTKTQKDDVELRKNLEQWGVVIVSGSVSL